MTTVAVIQPYFFPYAGYFRLFAGADIVVLFDCVQFPRRGWVHRNKFPLADGTLDWLTLPLLHAPRETTIADLAFASDVAARMNAELRRFPLLTKGMAAGHPALVDFVPPHRLGVVDYLELHLQRVNTLLGFESRIVRSSTMRVDPELRGERRIIEIVQRLQGSVYVNPPGGRELYDHAAFDREGLQLKFLTPYHGRVDSILARILSEPPKALRDDILAETALVD